MGQVPMWRFREPTQPSGPRSVIDRAESLIHLSDTCLFIGAAGQGFMPGTPKQNPVQWRKNGRKGVPRGIAVGNSRRRRN